MASIIKGFRHLLVSRRSFFSLLVKNYLKWLPDKPYLSILYYTTFGHCINWNHPRSFNEKLNWLKINNYSEEYVKLVDKAAVKEYVRSCIGDEHIIKTLFEWNSIDEVDWNLLPNQFVLKTTHSGGGLGVVICPNKNSFSKENAIRNLELSMNGVVGNVYRENLYTKVPRKIIAEEYLSTIDGDLNDYKFFCFNGHVRCFKIDFGRFKEHHANYFDENCNLLPFGETSCSPDFNYKCHIPDNIHEMIQLAEKLSSNHTFLRVDLYNVNGKIYFGELTFFPAGGMGTFTDFEWDLKLGNWLNLNTQKYGK